jgi:SP family general alpha glucoside:H+ symporter-like MFS transporter
LVRKGRLDEAEKSIRRLQRKSSGLDPKQTLAIIVHTNNIEEEMTAGTSYLDCFKGTERRRTEIACMAFAGQVFVGSLFAYNSTYFFQQIGFDSTQTYHLNVGSTGMALFGTLCNWTILLPRFGRRKIYLIGTATLTTFLFIIAFLQVGANVKGIGSKPGPLLNAQGAFTLLWTFTFQLSVGQLGWAIPAEIGSTRQRQKTVVLARNAYYLASVIARTLEPYFLNPLQWNIKGYTGFVWGCTGLITLIWAYFRLPETKDRTYDELDVLFAKGVKARHFAKTDVNTFDESVPIIRAAKTHATAA